jgi:hypothetical protein
VATALLVSTGWARDGDLIVLTVDQQIGEAQSCIAHSDATIARERSIAKETGVFDKNAMYWAGANKVHCRERLALLQRCKRSNEPCPPDPYAPTRVQYPAPSDAMP